MEALKQAEYLVSEKLAVFKTLLELIRLEAKLAGLSIIPILLNVCLLLIVLMTAWLFVSVLIGYGILLACNNILLTLFAVFFMNMGVLLYLAKSLSSHLRNMSFEKTRAYFSHKQSVDYEHLEKTAESTNSYER